MNKLIDVFLMLLLMLFLIELMVYQRGLGGFPRVAGGVEDVSIPRCCTHGCNP